MTESWTKNERHPTATATAAARRAAFRAHAAQHRTKSNTAAVILLAMSLTACSLADTDESRRLAEDVSETIAELRPAITQPYSVLNIDPDRPWTGMSRLEPEESSLPEDLLADNAVALSLAGSPGDDTLAATIEAATGIPVHFTAIRPPGAPEDPFQAAPEALPEGGIWTGPLDALLDTWATTRGYRWRYSPAEHEIEVVRSEAVAFRLNALAGAQTASASTSTSESGGGGGTGNFATQSINTQASYDPWGDITSQLTAILDPSTAVSAAPATASLAVAGLPRDIDRARSYLAWLNRTTLRPVTLTVAVYTVRFTSESDWQIGISGTLERVLGDTAGLSVLSNGISVIRPGPFADTLDATVGAMQEAGTVSRELTATVPSLNAQPAQFTELFSQAYLREIRTTLQDGLVQTNLIPGNVASGFALTYVAQIVSPSEVLLRLFASILDRPAFEVFTAGPQLRLQLPSYGNRAVQITQRVGRGETLVITGFRDRAVTGDRSGTFDPSVPLPFGGLAAEDTLTEQVLLVTAEVGEPLGIIERDGETL